MSNVLEIKGTQYIENPEWNGNGFSDIVAQKWWGELPVTLREIVISEIAAGNELEQILRNNERDIVLISLSARPMIQDPKNEAIKIHKSHSYGNYCYDGTFCTYEEVSSGCFISFEDPGYEQENF